MLATLRQNISLHWFRFRSQVVRSYEWHSPLLCWLVWCLVRRALFLGFSPDASAQLTLNLTTTASQPCQVVTDSQGIRSDPSGGTGMIATGVTMTGAGCGNPVVAPTPSSLAVFSSPTSGNTGTTFTVGWSVANATSCVGTATRDGNSLASLAGWTTTTAIAGPRSVTLSTAGNYVLSLACSNSAGTASGSVTIPVQNSVTAPTPNPLVLTPSATTGNVGDTFSIGWAVSGAASCTGSVTLDGSAVSTLSGWTTTTSTSGPRSVTLNTAGTYAFAMTCSNTAGSTSGSTNIVISSTSAGDQCGQQQSGQVYFQVNNSATADITKFENILGKASSTTTAEPFPGVSMSPWINNMGKTAFIAAKFIVPSTIAPNQRGTISLGENYPFPNKKMDISLSPTCGFTQDPPDSNCKLTGLTPGQGITWKLQGSGVACTLTAGQTYYMNIKFSTPPTSTASPCTASTCVLPLLNNLYTQ
jgi:hypothetical protein